MFIGLVFVFNYVKIRIMIIKSANYLTSVVSEDKILNSGKPEFAFVGRSNVGKSSLINNLTNNKNLAKASSTPGKTKMINYFEINNQFMFVDLPGYGYAKVGKSHLNIWSSLIDVYLKNSNDLQTIFVLLDIRHEPSLQDRQMIEYLVYNNLPFMVIATKADKIAKSKIKSYLNIIVKTLNIRQEMIIVSSSQSGLGRDKILNYIENKLDSAL